MRCANRLSCYSALLLLIFTAPLWGQSQTSVPRFIKYNGTLRDGAGKPMVGTVGVSFALYKEEEGGSPLWVESQSVQLDALGRYAVELGATKSEGLPQDLFVSGEARWLGVRAEGQAEQPRTLLLSVPYALKAGDAETVGGLPASAFLLAGANGSSSSSSANGASGNGSSQPSIGGSGTQNFIPLWTDNNGDLGNSVLFQSGTGSSAKTGVNTTTPAATLDVNGGEIVRGAMQLPATGTATAAKGFTSQPLQLQGSSFNSTTQQAIGPVFQLQTEPASNNTASPSGTLNLLYSNGSGSPTETGLNIASNGQIKFASGQTFPGAGTITGITAGTGLSGGGTSGNVTLSINIPFANQNFANLNNANTFTKSQTVNGAMTAQQFISTAAQGTAPLQVTSTTQVANLNASFLGGLSASAFQPAGSYATLGSNSFNGSQNVTGNVTASGTVSGGAVNTASTYQLQGKAFAFGSANNESVFLGFAGGSNTNVDNDTAVGYQALSADTGGDSTAVGAEALVSTSGPNNVAVGYRALTADTAGGSNTAVGTSAMKSNTTGNDNNAFGALALFVNTTGSNNNAIGEAALIVNTTGNNNSASGFAALGSNSTGSGNTADGDTALGSNSSGSFNTGVGYFAGSLNNQSTTGSNDTYIGANSGSLTQTNLTNATAIGANAAVTTNNSLVLGSINGVNGATADTNVGIGTTSPLAKLDVHGNANFTGLITFAAGQTFPGTGTITGVTAGTDLTGGGTTGPVTLNLDTNKVPQLIASNTFTGNQGINGNLTATGAVSGNSYLLGGFSWGSGDINNLNVFMGFASPVFVGKRNTGIGAGALTQAGLGNDNTAMGANALAFSSGTANTGFGSGTLGGGFATGNNNTAVGTLALNASTTGANNTATGASALGQNQTGSHDTAVGTSALAVNVGGSFNTAVGDSALSNGSGNSITCLGYNCNVDTDHTNSTAIGANAEVTQDNSLILGSIKGVNGATADTNVGIGITAPTFKLHIGVGQNDFRVEGPPTGTANPLMASFGGNGDFAIDAPGVAGGRFIVKDSSGEVGIATNIPFRILTVGQGKGHPISDGWDVYSSRRWKSNIQTLPDALSKVEQLRGVSYDLKDSGKHEIGVIAEEVGKVVPEVVTYETNGKDAQGVDYSRLTALLIEAVKQQQRQIIQQQKQIREQQKQISVLRTQARQQAAKNALTESRLARVESSREGGQMSKLEAAPVIRETAQRARGAY